MKKLVTLCMVASCFTGFMSSTTSITPAESKILYKQQASPLPTEDQVKASLQKIYKSDGSVIPLRTERLVRLPAPNNQEKIKINFEFTPTETQKIVFEDCFDEFNEIFSVINPDYQFVPNYTPTEEDFLNPYSIDIQKYDEPEGSTSSVAGRAYVPSKDEFSEIDGEETYDSHIELRSEVFSSNLKLSNVFKHEFMHCLGAGDAYKNGVTAINTVMGSVSEESAYLKSNDVAFLDALYHSPTNCYSEEFIKSYIENYELYTTEKTTNLINQVDTLQQHIWSNKAKQIVDSIDQMDKSNIIAQIKNLGYKESITDDLILQLSTTQINREFGKDAVRFAEAPLAKISYTKIYTYSEYKVPFTFKGTDYTNYFAGSYLCRRDYNAQATFSKGLSVCDDAHGLINPLGSLYINISNYVVEFDINNDCDLQNITKDNISITAKKIHILTDLTPQSYFDSIFKTSATLKSTYNEMVKN